MQSRTSYAQSFFNFGYDAVSTIGHGVYDVGVTTLSYIAKIATPIIAPIEYYTIGNLRIYLNNPAEYLKKLTAEARGNEEGFALVHFGVLLGNVAIWLPKGGLN